MDSSVKCGNCRFVFVGDYNLYCRKNVLGESGFPQTYEGFWCGEFKRKLIHEEDNRNLDPDKLPIRQCGNCIHCRVEDKPGEAIPEHQKYICTYNPPVIVMDNVSGPNAKAHTMFPHVDKESSCSKFRVKEIIINEEPQNVLTPGKRAITFGNEEKSNAG